MYYVILYYVKILHLHVISNNVWKSNQYKYFRCFFLTRMSRKLLKLGAIGAGTILAYKHLQSSYQPKFPQLLQVRAEELSGVQHFSHGTDQCILVIGTTGTGKSSTISKCTGQSVEVSDRADSVTRKCQIFADLKKSSQPVWIDTVGYDDTTRLDDEESFKSVLKFIQQENLLKIKAIIWTILPQERKDARLQVTRSTDCDCGSH